MAPETAEVCAPEPGGRAQVHEPRPASARVIAFALVGIGAAAVATYAMWHEAVDHRATSGEGKIMVAVLPFTAVAVVLVLWLITALLDLDRPRAVRLLTGALVATTLLGWWAVVAATEGAPLGR